MKYLALIVCLVLATECFALSKEDVKEIAHAAEAAPLHITGDATFLKFRNSKFVKIKNGKNNFTCFVVREPKGRYEPSCLNEQAVRSILPAYELHMKLLYKGLSYDETYAAIDKAFKSGKLPTAETGSLVYMMSPNNKFYYKGKIVSTLIHHMYFYPKLDDKVFSLAEGPISLWQGFPHLSALIVSVPGAQDHNQANHRAH